MSFFDRVCCLPNGLFRSPLLLHRVQLEALEGPVRHAFLVWRLHADQTGTRARAELARLEMERDQARALADSQASAVAELQARRCRAPNGVRGGHCEMTW